MTVNEWVEAIQRQGVVCNDYMRKLNSVTNKAELFRVLCDVNGGTWLFELHAKGVQIPIESFVKEFKNYINGNKVVDYPNGYTSEFYCRFFGGLVVKETIEYFLECKDIEISIPYNHYPTIVLSKDSNITHLYLREGARANIELYGNAHLYLIEGDKSKVRITKH